jgi:hypothetical protein
MVAVDEQLRGQQEELQELKSQDPVKQQQEWEVQGGLGGQKQQHERRLQQQRHQQPQQQALLLRLAFAVGNLTTDYSSARLEAAAADGWVDWLLCRSLKLSAWRAEDSSRSSSNGIRSASHQGQQTHPWEATNASHIQQRPRANSSSDGSGVRPLSGCGGIGSNAASGHVGARYSLAGAAAAAATAAAMAAAPVGSSTGSGGLSIAHGGAAAIADGDEELLVKLLRLVANVGVEPSIGLEMVKQPATATLLVNVLQRYSFDHQEEVVLNAVAALTNLSFYDTASNQVRRWEAR